MNDDLAPPPPIDFAAVAARLAARAPPPAPDADREERAERLRYARVADREMRHAILDHPDAPCAAPDHPGSAAAAGAVIAFAADRSLRTLTLSGPTGTGKTWAACWILARHDGLLLPFASITPTREGGGLYDRGIGSAMLVLNDLAEPTSEWQARQIAALLADRHDAGRRTIVTSNLVVTGATEAEQRHSIARLYGDRVADRLRDKRFSRAVECAGASLRAREP